MTDDARGSRFAWSARGYAIMRSLAPLRQRPFASLFTLLVLGITLTLPVLLWFGADALDRVADRDTTRASLTAYLALDVPDLDGAQLASELADRPGIAQTRYISRDEAYVTLANGSDLAAVLDTLDDNPLPGAIIVYPDDSGVAPDGRAERAATLADTLEGIDEVERVHYDLAWIERLAAAVRLLQVIGLLLGAFLTLTALMVIGNTIRLELLRRRAEREVTELLGASRAFRDRPFLYAGALYGLIGGIIALLLALLAWTLLKGPADALMMLYGSDSRLAWPRLARLAAVPLIAMLLGLIGALFSLYGPSRMKVPTNR